MYCLRALGFRVEGSGLEYGVNFGWIYLGFDYDLDFKVLSWSLRFAVWIARVGI